MARVIAASGGKRGASPYVVTKGGTLAELVDADRQQLALPDMRAMSRRRPLVIELYCGMFGWSAGWLALGGHAIGFDVEHQPWHGPVPHGAELVLQDVLTLDGRQFKDADLILASPPCQEFSWRAMPWTRAKEAPPPELGMTLFNACFRIQREASAAAGRHIPMVVENVRGAQRWVGRAAWHYGSYCLWGDIPALMPIPAKRVRKNAGGSWFNVAHNTTSGVGRNPVHDGVKQGGDWFRDAKGHALRRAASALIARIPERLSRHIAEVYWPHDAACAVEASA